MVTIQAIFVIIGIIVGILTIMKAVREHREKKRKSDPEETRKSNKKARRKKISEQLLKDNPAPRGLHGDLTRPHLRQFFKYKDIKLNMNDK